MQRWHHQHIVFALLANLIFFFKLFISFNKLCKSVELMNSINANYIPNKTLNQRQQNVVIVWRFLFLLLSLSHTHKDNKVSIKVPKSLLYSIKCVVVVVFYNKVISIWSFSFKQKISISNGIEDLWRQFVRN